MADKYFVGTGNRNLVDDANWSLTSGGLGGAGFTPITDSAIFDNNSGAGTITINAAFSCLNFNAGGLTANLTLSGNVYSINIYGSLVDSPFLLRTMTGTSYLYFKSTTTGQTITSNGATAGWNRIYFDGVGGEWTNQDNWSFGISAIGLYLLNGHWNTNSKNITTSISGSLDVLTGTKTLSLGASVFTVGSYRIGVPANFTFNRGTSKIVVLGNEFRGGSLTYNDVELTFASNVVISSVNTFSNLIRNSGSNINANISIDGNQTVTNTLTLTGANAQNFRLLVASNSIGTPRTITVNGSIVASNVDFRDITIAGTAAPVDLSAITGGSGDCGGNSGITFTPSQTQYYKHLGGGTTTWKDATKWFSDSGLTTAGRVPLPQDDPLYIAGSFNATTTLQVDCPRIGRSLNMEGVANAVTMQLMNTIECYGSFVTGSSITHTGAGFQVLFRGLYNHNINIHNTSPYALGVVRSGIYTFISDYTNTGAVAFYVENGGTLILNGYNFNIYSLYLSGSIFNCENSIINLRGNMINTTQIGSANTIHASGSFITFNPDSGTADIRFNLGGKIFNKVRFSGLHTGNFDVLGSNTFNEIIIDKGRKVRFTAGTTQQIAKFTPEIDAAAPITITSPTAAQHTLNYTGSEIVEADYLNLSYSKATPANKWYAGDNSVDGGNNTGWLFESAFTPFFWIW